MPISYEPAQPFNESISYNYGRTVQNDRDGPALRQAAQNVYGGGRGSGGGGGDSDIQAAINNRDANAMRAGMYLSDRDTQVNRDQFQQQAAVNMQQGRFELQAQLQEAELSQQEKMRLARMKNAVGEVSADPSLSAEEKSDMILQLKTGIDPYENRLKKQRVAQEQLVKEQMVEQRRAATALAEEELAVHAKKMTDRTSFVPDPIALAEIAADMRANMPNAAMIPQGLIMQMAEQEAMVQGLGTHLFQKSARNWDVLPGAGGEKGKGKGKDDGADHPLMMTPQDYTKQRAAIVADIRKDAAATKDVDGTKVPVDPFIQDRKGREDRLKEIMEQEGLPFTLTEFNAMRPKAEAGTKSGYKSKFGRPEVAAAATPAGPGEKLEPFDPSKPETMKPVQRQMVASLEDVAKGAMEQPGLTGEERQTVVHNVQEAGVLLRKYGSVENMTRENPEDRAKHDELLAEVKRIMKPTGPKPKIGSRPPAPAGRPGVDAPDGAVKPGTVGPPAGYYAPSVQLPRTLGGQ